MFSKETGRPYFTAKRASIPTTFDEQKCKSLIGSTMPGIIRKEECEEYEFDIPDSKETIILSHTYTYVPEAVNEEDSVFADDSELN